MHKVWEFISTSGRPVMHVSGRLWGDSSKSMTSAELLVSIIISYNNSQ